MPDVMYGTLNVCKELNVNAIYIACCVTLRYVGRHTLIKYVYVKVTLRAQCESACKLKPVAAKRPLQLWSPCDVTFSHLSCGHFPSTRNDLLSYILSHVVPTDYSYMHSYTKILKVSCLAMQ